MKGRMSTFERRIEILFMITNRRYITLSELADCFGVHKNTIYNDISFLSRYAPIYTKCGVAGGVYLLEGHSNKLFSFLSQGEKELLVELLKTVDPGKQMILQGIINKYSMPKPTL